MLANQSLYVRRAVGVTGLVMALLAVQTVAATPASSATHSIWLNPSSGPAGSSVQVNGSGFAPLLPVQLCWNDSTCSSNSQLGTVPGGTGAFSFAVTIPSAAPGVYRIYACQLQSLLPCASDQFEVVDPSPPPDTTTTTVPEPSTTTTTLPGTTTTVPGAPPPTTTTTTPPAGSAPTTPGTTQPDPTSPPPGTSTTTPISDPDQPDTTTGASLQEEAGPVPGEEEEPEGVSDLDEENESVLAASGSPPTSPQAPPPNGQPNQPQPSGPAAEVLGLEVLEAASSQGPGWTLRSPVVLAAVWMLSMVGAGLVLIGGMWLAGKRRQSPAG